jgi:hypothetical protein
MMRSAERWWRHKALKPPDLTVKGWLGKELKISTESYLDYRILLVSGSYFLNVEIKC